MPRVEVTDKPKDSRTIMSDHSRPITYTGDVTQRDWGSYMCVMTNCRAYGTSGILHNLQSYKHYLCTVGFFFTDFRQRVKKNNLSKTEIWEKK